MKVLTLGKDQTDLDLIYNGVDCMVTLEVYNELQKDILSSPPSVLKTYKQSMSMLAPALSMSLRGILVDEDKRSQALKDIKLELVQLQGSFDYLCRELTGKTYNVASWKQVDDLLYRELGLPGKGTGKPVLSKLHDRLLAKPFVSHILAIRDKTKQLQNLSTELEDGRFTTTLNVAGTSTGRMSSRKSAFDKGGNLQNIDRRHRGIFVADPGMLICEIDLEQADSRNVGAICLHEFGDSTYLDYCESGDLHTSIAQMVWPEIEWGDNPREVAERPYTATDSRRQVSKKCGHATNFLGSANEIGAQVGIPSHIVDAFQKRYLAALPIIRVWQDWTLAQLKRWGELTTLFGRRRMFHGRPDKQTHKKALAYQASSMTSHEIDYGILQIFRRFPWVHLMNQGHDSAWIQIPEDRLDELSSILEAMECHLTIGQRDFFVPLEALYGKNMDKEEMAKWPGTS